MTAPGDLYLRLPDDPDVELTPIVIDGLGHDAEALVLMLAGLRVHLVAERPVLARWGAAAERAATGGNDGGRARTAPQAVPVSAPAAQLIRLLGATVELIADYDPIGHEPVLLGAVHDAVQALSGLVPGAMEGMAPEALQALQATVAELPQ